MSCWRPTWHLTGQRVVAALETLSARRPLLKATTVDHGTEFASKALDEWAYSARRDALLHPARQAYGERICREFQWAAAGRMPQRT